MQGVPIDDDARALRRMFRSLRESAGAPGGDALGIDGHPTELEGVFRQMRNPEEFRRMVMPGLSDEERRGVPNTFQVPREERRRLCVETYVHLCMTVESIFVYVQTAGALAESPLRSSGGKLVAEGGDEGCIRLGRR